MLKYLPTVYRPTTQNLNIILRFFTALNNKHIKSLKIKNENELLRITWSGVQYSFYLSTLRNITYSKTSHVYTHRIIDYTCNCICVSVAEWVKYIAQDNMVRG